MNAEQTENYNDLADWRAAAKAAGFTTHLISRSKHNAYYQAWASGVIVGFFNTHPQGPISPAHGTLPKEKP